MRFLRLAVLISFSVVIFTPGIVFAKDPTLGKSRISPASPFYFLKPIREILEIKFAGTTHIKALFKLEFANRRIREVNSLVKTPEEDLIQPTLEKYWFFLQQLKSILDLNNKEMAGKVTGAAAMQMDDLQRAYREVTDPKAKMSLRLAIFRLSEWEQGLIDRFKLLPQSEPALIEKVINLKVSGCNFLSKEASSAALNEVEKTVFASRANSCFDDLRSPLGSNN